MLLHLPGPSQLSCGVGLGFSFGVGYDCRHFADCTQPGLTNHALAASMISSATTLGCNTDHSNPLTAEVSLIAQWEVGVCLAEQLGVDRSAVDTTERHSSFQTMYAGTAFTVYIVGNPVQQVGAYISTDGVAQQMVQIITADGQVRNAIIDCREMPLLTDLKCHY